MSLEKINTLEELKGYFENHVAVKSSLLNQVVAKSISLTGNEIKAAELIIENRFFSKISEVISVLERDQYLGLRRALIDIIVEQGKVNLMENFERRNLLDEADILKFFNQPRSIVDYLVCLRECTLYSRIYSEAVCRLDKHDFKDEDLLILLNALNQMVFGKNSLLLSLQYQDLFNYFFFGALIDDDKEASTSLKQLRLRVAKKGLFQIQEPFHIHFLTDLIGKDDLLEVAKVSQSENNIIKWIRFEQSLKNEFEIDVSLFSALEISTLFESGNFTDLWDYYSNAVTSRQIYFGFCALKLNLFQFFFSNLKDDLDYEKLLNDSLMAYYLNGLYKLKIIKKLPAMDEIFNWPTIHEVRSYIRRFEGVFNDHSPLGLMGYSVKQNSVLTKKDRQYILRRAFIDSDFSYSNDYNWGFKGSPNRLKCIASHLAMLIRNAKRQSRNYDQAIERWEKDLEFLKKEFYDERCAVEFYWSEIE